MQEGAERAAQDAAEVRGGRASTGGRGGLVKGADGQIEAGEHGAAARWEERLGQRELAEHPQALGDRPAQLVEAQREGHPALARLQGGQEQRRSEQARADAALLIQRQGAQHAEVDAEVTACFTGQKAVAATADGQIGERRDPAGRGLIAARTCGAKSAGGAAAGARHEPGGHARP